MGIRSMFFLILFLTALAASALTSVNVPAGPNNEIPAYITAVQLASGNRWHFFSGFVPGHAGTKILANVQLPNGSWVYSQSVIGIDMATTHGNDAGASVAVGNVLAYGVAPNTYYNPADGHSYLGVMYFTYQSSQDLAPGVLKAGRICLSYTNNGTVWTRPITAVVAGSGNTWSDCSFAGSSHSTYTESVAGYHHSATEMHIFWLEGDIALDQNNVGSGQTMTYYATTTPGAPYLLTLVGQLTSAGIYSPTVPGMVADNLLINLDISAVPSLGAVVMSRAFAYPNDAINGTIPCPSDAPAPCPRKIAQLPNRLQAYCLKTYGDDSRVTNGTWNLAFDIGNGYGWKSQNPSCSATPLANPYTQQNLGIDFNTTGHVKNPDGTLWLNGPTNAQLLLMGGVPGCGAPPPPISTPQLYAADISVCQYSLIHH